MDSILTALIAAAMLAAYVDARPGLRFAIGAAGLALALYLFVR